MSATSSTKLELMALAIVIVFSAAIAYNGLFVEAQYFLPAYDNALLHAGRARVVLQTQTWAWRELVFGGVTPSYHLPAYPTLVATIGFLGGIDLVWSTRVVALLLSIALPITLYLFLKRIGANWYAATLFPLLVLLSPPFLVWGTRTTPIALGVALIPATLFFVASRATLPALASASLLALTHQPSLLVLFATLCLYLAISAAFSATFSLRLNALAWLKNFVAKHRAAIVATLVALFVYLSWHILITGFTCLDFKCLPQLAAREFGKPVDLLEYFSKLPAALGLLGFLVIVVSPCFHKLHSKLFEISYENKLLLLSWFFATLALVKNEIFGFGVFTERFVTFFDVPVAALAALLIGGAYALLSAIIVSRFSKKQK